jgi:hypothetical protein
MLRIGGECRKCLNYDDERGCKIMDTITMTRNDEDVVYCIEGIRRSESDDEALRLQGHRPEKDHQEREPQPGKEFFHTDPGAEAADGAKGRHPYAFFVLRYRPMVPPVISWGEFWGEW